MSVVPAMLLAHFICVQQNIYYDNNMFLLFNDVLVILVHKEGAGYKQND